MEKHWLDSIEGEHLKSLYAFYSREWWTKDRSRIQINKMLEGSDILIGYCDDDELVGFARVLTDYTFKAFIFDVIVSEPFRGKKVGSAIIDRVLNHPRLVSVGSFELYCPDSLIPYYRQFGFEPSFSSLMLLKR